MSFYQEIKTAKAAAIGTIMPWTGGVSDIPDGWIPCDGSQISAGDFPLLARAIGDTYNLSTAVTEGLISTFSAAPPIETNRTPGTYTSSPDDGSGGGATFSIVVNDAGTQAGGAPNGVGGSVVVAILQQGLNYQVGDTLTIPSGNSGNGSDIIVTINAVEQGTISTFQGQFPNYQGEIVLPALINRPLVDQESDYFGPASPTGRLFDQQADAISEVVPYIGVNTDTGVPTSFNDVATDVVFELAERNFTSGGDSSNLSYFYSGKLTGNTIIPGSGTGTKIVYFGPRKLGRGHLKSHNHSGNIETIKSTPTLQPGKGVVPWSNVTYTFSSQVEQSDDDIFITDDNRFIVEYSMDTPNRSNSKTGFDNGVPGRTVAGITAENPPVNWTPSGVVWNPIKTEMTQPENARNFTGADPNEYGGNALSGGIFGFNKGEAEPRAVAYGIGGNSFNISSGQTSFYPDLLEYVGTSLSALSNPTAFKSYDTLNSNPGWDFTRTVASGGTQDVIQSHTHDEFDVNFQLAGLRPLNTINVYVTAPNANLNLDNDRNVGVFQINFNTTQPGMTCVYIIRAY